MDAIELLKYMLAIYLLLEIVDCTPLQGSLVLTVVQVSANNATIRWMTNSEPIANCTLAYKAEDETEVTLLTHVSPTGHQIVLENLHPHSNYTLDVECMGPNGQLSQSEKITFKTVTNGTVLNPFTNTHGGGGISFNPVNKNSADLNFDRDSGTISKKLSDPPSTLGVVMGVLLGLAGGLVLGIIGFYIYKKLRRRRQLARFLRYREHDDEEPFPSNLEIHVHNDCDNEPQLQS
ncbi:unnamed protein product [Owenia fusiformis]|uniref:Fibronectin type-III domain-containing protein n=1 Tax=Owenia fusiformis TaxID=6347 RepID=A0A8S4N2V3_OWEFU|nr:unnamed protein product [Owenia fusiformis]